MNTMRLSLLLALAACTNPFVPAPGAKPFDVSDPDYILVRDYYPAYFAAAVQCTGLTPAFRFEDVRWLITDVGETWDVHGIDAAGAADIPHRAITLTRHGAWDIALVEHEIAHLLVGHGGHPADPFAKPCLTGVR